MLWIANTPTALSLVVEKPNKDLIESHLGTSKLRLSYDPKDGLVIVDSGGNQTFRPYGKVKDKFCMEVSSGPRPSERFGKSLVRQEVKTIEQGRIRIPLPLKEDRVPVRAKRSGEGDPFLKVRRLVSDLYYEVERLQEEGFSISIRKPVLEYEKKVVEKL